MSINEVKNEEIRNYKLLNIISELAPLREYVRLLEKKHNCSFFEFERLVGEGEESFSNWDEYIEWKAYNEKIKDLSRKLRELENVSYFEITG